MATPLKLAIQALRRLWRALTFWMCQAPRLRSPCKVFSPWCSKPKSRAAAASLALPSVQSTASTAIAVGSTASSPGLLPDAKTKSVVWPERQKGARGKICLKKNGVRFTSPLASPQTPLRRGLCFPEVGALASRGGVFLRRMRASTDRKAEAGVQGCGVSLRSH